MPVDSSESMVRSPSATSEELFDNHPWKDSARLADERQRGELAMNTEQIAAELARLGLASTLPAMCAVTSYQPSALGISSLAEMYQHRMRSLTQRVLSSVEPSHDSSFNVDSSISAELTEMESDRDGSLDPPDRLQWLAPGSSSLLTTKEGTPDHSGEANVMRGDLAHTVAAEDNRKGRTTVTCEFLRYCKPDFDDQTTHPAGLANEANKCLGFESNYGLSEDASEAGTPVAFVPSLRLLRHQRQAVAWMIDKERKASFDGCAGGILADEPGLGKTLTAIALILTNRDASTTDMTCPGVAATLIICPLSLLRQWFREIRNSTIESLGPSVLIYHGPNRNRLVAQLAQADIVLTTYTVVCAECPQLSMDGDLQLATAGPLFQYRWHRLILDEAQFIRNIYARATRAACLLESRFRWCLTGTPIQNSIHDLLALLVFIRHPECSSIEQYLSVLNHVSGSVRRAPQVAGAFPVGRLLRPILLRRCRRDQIDGRPLLELESRSETIEYVTLSPAERCLYENMKLLGREALQRLSESSADSGICMHILVMLTRLRQICDHYVLLEAYMHKLRDDQGDHRQRTSSASTRSGHGRISRTCCTACGALLRVAERSEPQSQAYALKPEAFCEYCASLIGRHSPAFEAKRDFVRGQTFAQSDSAPLEAASSPHRSRIIDQVMSAWTSLVVHDTTAIASPSSKLQTLLALLDRARCESPTEKWVIFSQWPSFLDLCEDALLERGQAVCRVDGRMRYEERELNLELFRRSEYRVMLMSLGAGGVGLNLTLANHVVLVDPWWNPAVEEQAIDRVYRLGQQRPVQVIRLVVRDSVEERIMQLQQQKRALYEHVLGGDRPSSTEGRLTARDLHWLMQSA
jgi:SNF2 family DNA or RNA helicase